MKRFSVIIPTMQRSPLLWPQIEQYANCPHVAEIIIINNAKKTLKLLRPHSHKLTIINQPDNIMVNAAWNLGASLAKHTIILANDDISIHNTNLLFQMLEKSKHDLVGATVNGDPLSTILYKITPYDKSRGFPRRSFGCFMMVQSYKYIPEQLRILSGDKFLFDQAKSVSLISSNFISTPVSVTIRSNPEFNAIGRSDVQRYRHLTTPQPVRLNIIVRTSGRPRYFAACMASIKQHAPGAMVHVIIDDFADLDYVQESCKGLNYNYYQVNRNTVANFCSQIPITRAPFIFNYYFNVVKPFLKGTVIFLDDDDKLLMHPVSDVPSGNLHLYKAQVGSKIIPPTFDLPVKLNHISTLCVAFNAADMIDWTPQRGGDYEFIYRICQGKIITVHNHLLSATQTGGNWGKRNDLN